MLLLELIALLIIAGIVGAIGQALAGYSRGGCLASVVLGFIGALIGASLARLFDMPDLFVFTLGGRSFPLIWSIIGCALFVAVIGFLRRGR